MKEYKVVKPNLGWKSRSEKLEEILKNHAKQGWILHTVTKHEGFVQIIFERSQLLRGKPTKHSAETIKTFRRKRRSIINLDYRVKTDKCYTTTDLK
ncbi:uncharacterized protein DUF4177 [Kordia periserrulae]|uniref:Uncharacterized protein DUF4177 n=1 Tax=Kordia periserrulae TaxID=701523 RepID=A0A2T6BSF9_9FLAO|nr:DUF4177 domain-containing protein [Kordia periserrulae]PTX59035.1 uncharacterized protein DUF4177 [Kordia periserrulae]